MDMVEIGLIVLLGATVQSAIGFAYSLITLPLFLQVGMNLPQAVTMSFVTSMIQRVFFMVKHHKDVEWSKLKVPIIFCLLMLPLGIYLLGVASGESRTIVKQLVGGLVLTTVVLRTTIRIKPKQNLHVLWAVLAGSCSGILSGFNIGGPPIILWIYAHEWRKEFLRAACIAISLPMVPFQAGLLLWKFGDGITSTMLTGLGFAPLALLGIFLGLKTSAKANVKALRAVVTTLLIVIGAFYLLQPYLK